LQRLYRSAALLTESLPIDHHNQTTEQAFLEKINNDLDLPGALALVHQKISERNKDPFVISYETLLKFDTVLGLKIKEAVESTATETRYDEEITTLIKRRDQVRIDKNWSESDRLRKQIEDLGYEVEDTKDGTKIKKL
jgi:cysteinyl-tRNA synthetase